MIKVTMFLHRRPELSRAEFAAHHRGTHADLIRSLPEGRAHLLRYTQTHPAADAPDSGADATAELWFASEADLQAMLGSASFQQAVAADEELFVDRAATVVTVGEVVDIVGGATSEATGVAPLPSDADRFGVLPRGINHVGLTVPDLDAATAFLRAAFGAKVAYDGLTPDDPPRQGEETEAQLGLPPGARITRQRMIQIGIGPSIEMFQIVAARQQDAAGLSDIGLNHLSVYVDDIDAALARAVSAGGEALSAPHENSPHEDTEGNGSVYVRSPWGTLFELQTLPAGHWYDDDAETRVWTPPPR